MWRGASPVAVQIDKAEAHEPPQPEEEEESFVAEAEPGTPECCRVLTGTHRHSRVLQCTHGYSRQAISIQRLRCHELIRVAVTKCAPPFRPPRTRACIRGTDACRYLRRRVRVFKSTWKRRVAGRGRGRQAAAGQIHPRERRPGAPSPQPPRSSSGAAPLQGRTANRSRLLIAEIAATPGVHAVRVMSRATRLAARAAHSKRRSTRRWRVRWVRLMGC
jgi:hypothetical protein